MAGNHQDMKEQDQKDDEKPGPSVKEENLSVPSQIETARFKSNLPDDDKTDQFAQSESDVELKGSQNSMGDTLDRSIKTPTEDLFPNENKPRPKPGSPSNHKPNSSSETGPSSEDNTTNPIEDGGPRLDYRSTVVDDGGSRFETESRVPEVGLVDETRDDDSDTSSSSSSGSDSETFLRKRKRPSSNANSESGEKTPHHVLLKEKPKHKWFVVQEVINRQKGIGSRFQGSDLFRQRCYGSLHSVQRLELMYKLESHEGCVNTLHFNLGGTLLASGSDDLHIVIWNWAGGQPLVKYDSGHRSNVFQAKFLPLSCNTHIVSCSRDGQVRLGELSSSGVCRSTRKLGHHRGPVHKLAVQTEMPHDFLSCGEDGVVMSIDVRDSKPTTLATVKHDDRKIALYGIHSNPVNNNEFCVNGRSTFIRIYDKRLTTVPVKKFCPQHLISTKSFTQVTAAVFNYNGTEILGSYNDEDIYLFDTSLGEDVDYVHKYEGHRNNVTVKGVNFFGPKSEYIVSGSDCGNIFFWDKHTEAIVQWMAGDENGVVNCLEPHPQMPVIATSGLDSDVKIWVPSCEKEPSLHGLKEVVVSNFIDRENEHARQPSSIDSQMLMMLWRHMRRSERRKQERARAQGRSCGESATNARPETSDSDSTDSDDNDTTFEQCTPS